jgi:membrane-associated protein
MQSNQNLCIPVGARKKQNQCWHNASDIEVQLRLQKTKRGAGLMETSNLIEWGGIALVALLIFAETGLLLGLVIPGGETLVFTTGLLISTKVLHTDVTMMLPLLVVAGFAGDTSGYLIGRKFGPNLYTKKDTWYFKQKYLKAVQRFFIKYKKRTIFIGKFLPIIRPFTPLTAGITKLPRVLFFGSSLLATAVYMSTFLLAGYYLGDRFPQLKNYLHWVLPASVILLVGPVIWKLKKESSK